MTSGHERASGADAGGAVGRPAPRRGRLAAAVGGLAATGTLFLSGFAVFLCSLDDGGRDPPRPADAIVALTGGQGRIEDALDLLAKGYGGRLLITGVNERTSREAIKRLSPDQRDLVECCVDLDYRARNTVGNAAEIRRWATERGFGSLIVVTSDYHLPRTLAELDAALPGVAKVPHAVVGGRPADDWEARLARTRVVLAEYVKFLAVSVRTRVAGLVGDGGRAGREPRGNARPPAG